jgi:predicted  nucleic acid-binding Zn-ribbon protein
LAQVQPETWNNIPFPLVDAIKVLMEEIRALKHQGYTTNFEVKAVDKKVGAGVKEAAADIKTALEEIRRSEQSLKVHIEAAIKSNNEVIKKNIEGPVVAKIAAADEAIDQRFYTNEKNA